MGRYRLIFRKSVAKDLCDLPKKDVARIAKCFDLLAEDPRPHSCEKMSGQEKYRVRQGAYRIIYEVQDDGLVVLVVKGSPLPRGLQGEVIRGCVNSHSRESSHGDDMRCHWRGSA